MKFLSAVLRSSRWFIVCIFLLFSFLAQAAPVVLINEQFGQIRLDKNLDILDNPDKMIHAGNILQDEYINQFAPLPLYMPSALFHYGRDIWLRFTLRNALDVPEQLWFFADQALSNQLAVYRLHNGVLEPLKHAALYEKHYTPLLKNIELAPHSEAVIFIEVSNASLHALQLELAKPEVFFQESLLQRQHFSFGIGILTANALVCLVFALYFSAPFFMWQMFYVSAVAIVMLIGLEIPSGWSSSFSDWQFRVAFIATSIAALSALLATNAYLAEIGIAQRMRRYLVVVVIMACASFALLLVSGNGYTPLLLVVVSVVSIVILVAGFYGWMVSGERLVLIATIVRAVNGVVIIYLLASQTWFFIQLLNPAILFCMVVETSILSILYLLHMYRRKTILIHNQQMLQMSNRDEQTRSELVQELSHDIRTPLSAIIGITGLLKNSALTQAQEEKIDVINSSAQELIAYLARQQSRLQIDTLDHVPRAMPFELAQVIDVCMQAYQLQAERQQVELIVDIAADVPLVMKGDSGRLYRVLVSILSYLLRHRKQCNLVLKVSRASLTGDAILFSMVTSAVFANADDVESEDVDWRMAQQLLRSMGASLQSVLSKESQEYRFQLSLPGLNELMDDDNKTHEILRRKRVLVVDDNHTYCKVLKQQLSIWGMHATDAFDGEQAIAMVRTAKSLGNPFDALIIDFDMPHLSGLDVAERIQTAEGVPLMIMLTGAGSMPAEALVRKSGIAAVLHKPASPKLLQLTLANLLFNRSRQGDGQSLRQYRILVAEDNDVSRLVISKMLDSAAVHYKLVNNGQMALESVQRESFDLIFMDCEMPIMDGFEATKAIHQWQTQTDKNLTPVVALTAHTLAYGPEHFRQAGMIDFMSKPVTLIALQAMIFKYC